MMEFEVGGVKIGFSSLLVCMMLGTVFCNVCDFSAEIMDKTDRWTAPLYILFFVLSGAELELNVFSSTSVVLIGAAYIFARAFGKWAGASISAKFMKCPPKVQKWLGITLLPQAGVALGMSVTGGADAGRGWRDGAQYCPVRRADLRAGRPGADENRADRGRRYPAEGRGGRFGGRLSASPNPLKIDRKNGLQMCSPFFGYHFVS